VLLARFQKYTKPFDGWTNKFVFPPHDFSTCMITNFHTPKSTLLMMVSTFCGRLMKRAYAETIEEKIQILFVR
jgi:S-adenosylmethionine:tRNA ribosyltransferase-isomerase